MLKVIWEKILFLLKNGAIVVGIDIVEKTHLDSPELPKYFNAVDLTQEKLLIQVAQY